MNDGLPSRLLGELLVGDSEVATPGYVVREAINCPPLTQYKSPIDDRDDYDAVVTRDNDDAERVAANLARKCVICGQGFASDPEDYFRHATGEEVHMTCYDRTWTQ